MRSPVVLCCLVDPQGQLLGEIADGRMTQKDVAATYALAMTNSDEIDWAVVNRAIIDRWSMSGLRRIKELAWRLCA